MGWRTEVSSVQDPKNSAKSRRDFIAKCGRFAVVTPPTIALLLSASGRNYAQAFSGQVIEDRRRRRRRRR
jgi:hypothetical protein